MEILFFSKKTIFCDKAVAILKAAFDDNMLHIYQGNVGDTFPPEIRTLNPDYIISFLSPWIIPDDILKMAKVAAINFHPASHDYPGTGCYNFALYNNEEYYGAVCHHMERIVDTGGIILYKLFPIYRGDSVETLKLRTINNLLVLFQDAIDLIYQGRELPAADVKWTRKPYTRRELDDLCVITADMSEDEIARRVRATVYPNQKGPSVKIHDYEFKYDVPRREPLA